MRMTTGFIDPDDSAPDVYAVGEWRCDVCLMKLGPLTSSGCAVTTRTRCHCGTNVEIQAIVTGPATSRNPRGEP